MEIEQNSGLEQNSSVVRKLSRILTLFGNLVEFRRREEFRRHLGRIPASLVRRREFWLHSGVGQKSGGGREFTTIAKGKQASRPSICGKLHRFLCDVAARLPSSFQLSITENSPLSFFWDPWCGGLSIADRLKSEHMEHLIQPNHLPVHSVLVNNLWNLPFSLPPSIKVEILAVPISTGMGNCLWTGTDKPAFNSFHKGFFLNEQTVTWFKHVWHKRYALRFSLTTWMAFRNGLKTADNLIARGLDVNTCCIFCHHSEENHKHLFFECEFTFQVLLKVFPYFNCMLLRPNLGQAFQSIEDWDMDKSRKNYCFMLLCAIVYHLWRARNDRLFGNLIDCQNTIIAKIKCTVNLKISKWK
ncbi:uncharacterized protein LOC110115526 [Dendrobium catenatum]|uniref:uncharacterized protein LOC110115526 n=1 Tax=Dendrobium catenatum TaxID=906689 RepID=UPI0009F4ACBD|nr:uncharacterized protein LOC110115526 [Dendrobium catenatum]